MKKIVCLILVVVCMLPSLAVASPVELQGLTDAELLDLWTQAGEMLKERGAYPYIELRSGDKGVDVSRLQARLAELFYFSGEITGKYGESTENAVKKFEKENGLKQNGVMTVDDQDLLYSANAIAKPTPTPSPSPTPAPTPVPENAALEVIDISFRDSYNTPVFSIGLKNHTEFVVDTFTVVCRCTDSYGALITSNAQPDGISVCEDWQCTINPGKKFSMGSRYWYLFGFGNARTIEVAIKRYHTADGQTIDIDASDYVWYSSEKK